MVVLCLLALTRWSLNNNLVHASWAPFQDLFVISGYPPFYPLGPFCPGFLVDQLQIHSYEPKPARELTSSNKRVLARCGCEVVRLSPKVNPGMVVNIGKD